MNLLNSIKLFEFNLNQSNCCLIDLSENNEALKNIDTHNLEQLHGFIFNKIQQEGKKAGIGGYLERRSLYQKSEVFRSDSSNFRNIHLGVDIWCAENTAIYMPFDGEIHSFKNNSAFGDYGPTIITKHKLQNESFHLLFGHLTISSLSQLAVGKQISKGDLLAKLGTPKENVGWPPHLHFQVIIDMGNAFGDYPGVCSEKELDFYHNNCPNPQLFLQKF